MKTILKLFILVSLFTLASCEATKIGDTDLDFDAIIDTQSAVSYVGKPVRIGVNVEIADSQNDYPFETKVKAKTGLLKTGEQVINADQVLDFDYRKSGTFFFEYTPTEKGTEEIIITIKNELVSRTVSCTVECKDALYNVEIKDAPERPLIDTKFDFNLFVKEMEATGADSIVAYAKVMKGEGTVYSGEEIINLPLSGNEEKDIRATAANATRLAIGNNNISFVSRVEGENIIRFYFTNKWGIETFQDINTNIFLPEWALSNSEGKEQIPVPYQDNFSFTLDLTEKDIFKQNTYIGSYRVLSNTDLKLKINNKEYYQGAEIPLKAGGNVGVLNINVSGEGSIEFIVKDKYKQENKDTLKFITKLPVKPIEASLNTNSVSVKVNQEAAFTLTLAEQNYTDVFDVTLDQITGTGKFDGGTKLKLSEGKHTIKYVPATQGSHTFRITIKDSNDQEKILNATVQATVSPLVASLSTSVLNLNHGEKGQVTLTTTATDYKGKYNLSYTVTGTAHKFEVGTASIGVGGSVVFTENSSIISITASSLGTSNYILKVEDDYKQTKELPLKVVVKGKVTVTAGTGGTVTGGGTFDLNQSCTVKATANTGYSFIGWFSGTTKVSDNTSYTFKVTQSIALEARFSSKSYKVDAVAETGGTVTGAGNYEHGKTATLKAAANTGYTFAGWYNGSTRVSTSPEYSFTVTQNVSLTAKFTGSDYNITVNAQKGGTVSGGGSYAHNSTAVVKAVPDTGYSFSGWYNGSTKVSDAPSYSFTVTSALSLEARFTANKHAITVNAQKGGSVTGGGNFDYNSNISVKATAESDYIFDGWYENNVQVSPSAVYNFTVTKDRTLEARFKMKEFILTITAGTGGKATGGGTYEYNKTVTITATPDNGYSFDGWYENGAKISSTPSYAVKITGARKIEARFTANKLSVIVNAGTGGSASGSGSFNYNSNVTVVATPASNYTFAGWYDGNTKVSASASYTFKLLKEITLEARFTANKHKITVTGVNGTQEGGGTFSYGENATVKGTPATNYEFVGWYEGNSQVSTSNPYTFKVEKDRILEAKYKFIKRTLTLATPTGGTATGAGTFDHGTEVTVKATANTGYTFAGWYNGSTKVSDLATYTFALIQNITLTAKFNINKHTVTLPTPTGGTVSGAGSFDYNSQVTVKAAANTGYTFDGWYNGSTKVYSALEYSFKITANITLTAKFNINKYTITATSGGNGTVSGGGTFNHGANVTLKGTANQFYEFEGWYDGNTKVSSANPYTFAATANKTLQGRFKYVQGTFNLSVSNTNLTTFYNQAVASNITLSSSMYNDYKVKIVPTQGTATYKINNQDASGQKEVSVKNGSYSFSVTPTAKNGNISFKIVAYSDPKVIQEVPVNVTNQGVKFTATGGSSNLYTLSKTNATQQGWYLCDKGVNGLATFSFIPDYDDTFKIYADPANGIKEYLVSEMFTNPVSLKNYARPVINFRHGYIQLGENLETFIGSYTGKTWFEFESSRGGKVSKNTLKKELGWISTHTDYLIIANSAGYEQKISISIKFNR